MICLWKTTHKLTSGGGYNKNLLASLALATIVFLSALIISTLTESLQASAVSPTTISTDVVRASFGLSIETDPSVTLNVKPTPAGAMTIASSTVTTGTSSPSGYTLYLQMTGENSNTNSLINSVDATATLTSSGSFISPTVLANGTWGYAIPSGSTSLLSTNGFDDNYTEVESVAQTGSKFAAIPTTNSPAEKIAETNSPSVVELPVYYAAMASYDTISGTYSNKVLYTALADDGATPTMVVAPDRIAGSGNIPLTLVTSLYTTNENFSYSAYMLTPEQYAAVEAGTLDVSTLTSQKLASCSRDTSFDAFALNCRSVSLDHAGPTMIYLDIPAYDVHYNDQIMLAGNEDFYTISTMQEMTPAVCASVPTPAANADYAPTTYLTDSRDNKVYEVKKLADGNCWMTQNLALQDETISSADSNLPAGKTVTIPASSTDDWCTENSAACDNQLMTLDATDTSIPGQASAESDYGVYYNWYTATATYGIYDTSSGNVSYSICPKGWRLPTGGSSGEFQTLYNNYNFSASMRSTTGPAFVLSGHRNGGSTSNQGSLGSYWSSAAYGALSAYGLRLNSSSVYPADSVSKYNGFSVRCIADSFWNISDMQEMTSDTCATANTPAATATNIDTDGTHADDDSYVPQRTLYDIRDGNSYTIAKLPDGNCWMTQNLRLGDGTKTYTLTPANSDVSANWTLPIAQTSGSDSWGDSANTGNAKHVYATGNTSYGNYYNWYTATAGTGLGTMSSTSATSLTNATESICPKGWRLPDGGAVENSKSFYTLDKALGGSGANRTDATQRNKFIASPYSFPYSGLYNYVGGVNRPGSFGYWWSRSASTTAGGLAYYFTLDTSGNVYPQGISNVGYGFSVRCVNK